MIIAGAGSAGIETTGICLLSGCNDIVLYDDNTKCNDLIYHKYHVIKTEEDLKIAIEKNPNFCVAIGHPRIREKVFNRILKMGGNPTNVINHKTVSLLCEIPQTANILHPGVNISYDFEIGKSCMIHANVAIGHKVKMGNFINISPLCSIIGPCTIDDYAYIAAGSVILPHHKIGKNAIIPAGSVVDRDVNDYETYIK
jgi:sugar O-acyltransferase (sialic acid O-acetyltransferase NeuD family)